MSMLRTQSQSSTVANMLSAAEELFVGRAYSDVTIDEVAAAAGVTKGAVYHHFSSKEDLYLRMLQRDLAEKRKTHRKAVEFEGSCEERLRRLTRDFLALPENKRNLISLVRRDANIFTEEIRSALIQAYREALPDLVEQIISEGIAQKEITSNDPRLLAWHFVALVEVVLTPYAQQRLPSDKRKIDHVMSLFLRGCEPTSTEE